MAKILLMEDDYEEASLLSELLSELGHIVVTTHEATSALNIYGTSSFDLIITDVLVRGANQKKGGIFLIGAIRCQEVATKKPSTDISHIGSGVSHQGLRTRNSNGEYRGRYVHAKARHGERAGGGNRPTSLSDPMIFSPQEECTGGIVWLTSSRDHLREDRLKDMPACWVSFGVIRHFKWPLDPRNVS